MTDTSEPTYADLVVLPATGTGTLRLGAGIAFGLIRLLYRHVTAPDAQADPTTQELA